MYAKEVDERDMVSFLILDIVHVQAFCDLVLDNSELLFIHKNRLVSEALILNRTRVELCTDYWVDKEVWEVWWIEEGRKILNSARTSHHPDNSTAVTNNQMKSESQYFLLQVCDVLKSRFSVWQFCEWDH